jgi:hypothetical protein
LWDLRVLGFGEDITDIQQHSLKAQIIVGLFMIGIECLEQGTCKRSTSTTSWIWKLKRRHVADIL